MNARVLTLLFAIFICACGEKHPSKSATRHVASMDEAAAFYSVHATDAQSFFVPSASDIAGLEAALPAYLVATTVPEAVSISPSLPSYRVQFVGVVVDGTRRIFANYFRSDDPVDEPLRVADGGSRFFQVYFDPQTRSFSRLHINGSA